MKIENVQYNKEALTNKNVSINATIDGRQMSVPLEPANIHYEEILKQVKEGTLNIKDAD